MIKSGISPFIILTIAIVLIANPFPCNSQHVDSTHFLKLYRVIHTNQKSEFNTATTPAIWRNSVAAKHKPKNLRTAINPIDKLLLLPDADSGYVTLTSGVKFLVANRLTDTTGNKWSFYGPNDTIGKFYRLQPDGNFFYCTIDLNNQFDFETHLLIEIDKTGHIITSERYFHGNYPCCWNSPFDGFKRYRDYLGLFTCGTGSGYCSTYLYLFKEIAPQKSQRSIPLSYWSSESLADGHSHNFNSTMEWSNGRLIMHYTLEIGELYDDYSKFRTIETKKFDAVFTFNGHTFITADSARFNACDL